MYPLKLKPATKDYIWGGDRLNYEYGIDSPDSIVAEAWMLSCNVSSASTIMNGPLAGTTRSDALFSEVEKTLGVNNSFAVYFPILIKFIDAKADLSIQVHPMYRRRDIASHVLHPVSILQSTSYLSILLLKLTATGSPSHRFCLLTAVEESFLIIVNMEKPVCLQYQGETRCFCLPVQVPIE